jgi:hypothetical protein
LPITVTFGGNPRFNTNSSVVSASTYYQDGTGKLLPNHIHLLTSAGAVPSDANSGPFFDQFIHAPVALNVSQAWQGAFESTQALLPRLQGFIGKFGSNGYNSTKTRGVLGGNAGALDPETGFTFLLGEGAVPIADAAYSSVLVLLSALLTVQHVLLMMTRVKILAKDSLLVKIHQ